MNGGSLSGGPVRSSEVSPLAGVTVLQIIPTLEAGGAERTTVDVAAALAEAGARPLVATEGGRLVGELQSRGGEWVPFPARTKNPLSMLLNVRRLARIAHDEKVAIIHARSRAPAWVGLGAARTLDSRTSSSNGFSMKSTAPAFIASTAIGTSACPVMTMTGGMSPRSFSRRRSAIPSISGSVVPAR